MKKIHYYSELFTSLLGAFEGRARPRAGASEVADPGHRASCAPGAPRPGDRAERGAGKPAAGPSDESQLRTQMNTSNHE